MKRVILMVSILGLAACSDPTDFEVDAVVACETLLKRNLVAADTFNDRGIWKFSQSGRVGTIRRDYSAQNALGMRVNASYICKYNANGQKVTALRTIGPLGTNVILEDHALVQQAKRIEKIQEGAERALDAKGKPQPTGPGERRWITNLFFTGCPQASDWFEAQDAVEAGRWDFELPSRCFDIPVGTIVLAPSDEHRKVVTRNGHDYQKARLEDGREFWTDQLDEMSLSPL